MLRPGFQAQPGFGGLHSAEAEGYRCPVKTLDPQLMVATPSGYMVYDDGDIVSVHDYTHWSFNPFWHLQAHFERVTRETRYRKKVRLAVNNA